MSAFPNATPLKHAALLRTPGVCKALTALLEGYEYAHDLGTSPWEFAVEVSVLLKAGCMLNTLRWLARRGYAEYAVLSTADTGARGRRPSGPYRERPEGPCFILTDRGARAAQAARAPLPADTGAAGSQAAANPALPAWDNSTGELRFHGELVKRYRKTSSNQRAVLDAFQKAGWPERLGDPLPASEDRAVNRKHRLQDTIRNLNRAHERRRLRFYGTEGGRCVAWKPLT